MSAGAGRRVAVFGSVPFAAPWLTEHNLAWALHRRTAVEWIDPPRSPLTPVRARLARRSARAPAPRPGAAAAGLPVHRPVVLPPVEHPVSQRLSFRLLRAQLAHTRRGRPLAVFARGPRATVGMVAPACSVYLVKDWIPAGAHLLGRSREELEREVLSMCRRVDLVCAVTERLRATLAERGIASRLLRHGFPAELVPLFDGAAPPGELAALPRPLLGYVGRIDDRLDFAALAATADRVREGTVVLVGPVSPRLSAASRAVLGSRPNLVVLGARPRDAVPGHLAALDCALLPYREDAWGAHGSPLKLWEYLYAGCPIVASGYEVLREYGAFVEYVAPADLADAAAAAVAGRAPEDRAQRRALARATTWDDRAAELLRMAEPLLEGQAAPPAGG